VARVRVKKESDKVELETKPKRKRTAKNIAADADRTGRPTITEDTTRVERLVEALQIGMPRDDACIYAGFARSSFYRVLADGKDHLEADEDSQTPEAIFTIKVLAAEAKFKFKGLRTIDIIAKNEKNPDLQLKAIMFALERRDPKNFGRRVDVTSGDEPIETGVMVMLPSNGRETPG
jgi:hypothetical protein